MIKLEPILTIIISSYNRSHLLIRNLKLMLHCKADNVEFIVCDNGSSDDTWEKLLSINDPRLIKKRNLKNYGFDNFWLVSFDVYTRYFMFLNDRDYISCTDLEALCKRLEKIEIVDFISCDRGNYETGYYPWIDAVTLYFQSRHPGTLIYNANFCKRVLKKDIILKCLEESKPQYANNYLVFQLLLYVKHVYAYSKFMIIQPDDRESIRKMRKEYYSGVYLSLEYRVQEYYDWLIYAKKFKENERTRRILEAIYKDSLKTVTIEYYYSLRIPGFKKRNDCEDLKVSQWFINGIQFCRKVYKKSLLLYPDMKDYILFTTMAELSKAAKNICLEPLRKIRRFCEKELCRLWTT